ncbi:MAG: homoserine kinase [Elusimicrobiota bacterium]
MQTRESSTRIRVRVPATTSNLGPGFDVLGMALQLYCELDLKVYWRQALEPSEPARPRPATVRVDLAGEGADALPRDESNMVVRSFDSVCPTKYWDGTLLHFAIKNGIPVWRGLGSSAAARLCGLLAGDALLHVLEVKAESPLEIVERACEFEGHPDNAVPAFYGGLRASLWNGGDLLHFGLKVPKDLGVVVCVPDFKVPTEKARKVLPKKVSLRDAVHTASHLAFLIKALESGEYAWLKTAMQDVLHQPYRKPLVRGMDAVIRDALKAGAFGAALSGSGPTVLALTLRGPKQAKVGRAMQKAFLRHGKESRYLALDVDNKGAVIDTR